MYFGMCPQTKQTTRKSGFVLTDEAIWGVESRKMSV